jgi:hypothetical protein
LTVRSSGDHKSRASRSRLAEADQSVPPQATSITLFVLLHLRRRRLDGEPISCGRSVNCLLLRSRSIGHPVGTSAGARFRQAPVVSAVLWNARTTIVVRARQHASDITQRRTTLADHKTSSHERNATANGTAARRPSHYTAILHFCTRWSSDRIGAVDGDAARARRSVRAEA